MDVTRTFDIIQLNLEKYPREDMYGGKKGNEWVRYSTNDVADHIDWISIGLMSMGFTNGDKIATIMPNKPEWNFFDMGLAQVGLIHVPVYPTISTDEYAYILEHSDAKAVIVGNKSIYNKVKPVTDKLNAVGNNIFSIDTVEGVRSYLEIIEAGKNNAEKYRDKLLKIKESIKPDDIVTIIYTSGTTGNSKGVMLSHSNLVKNAISTSKVHHLGYKHRALSFLPLCHVYERMMNYHFQYKGISVYYVENMATIAEIAKEVKPHLFNTVPRLLEKIYDNIMLKGRSLSPVKKVIFFWAISVGEKFKIKGQSWFYKLRLSLARKLVLELWKSALGGEVVVIVSGGAALQARLERIFWAAGLPVIQGYGLTETSPVIAVNPFRIDELRLDTVGPVLENVEVKIANDGEILCRGVNVMIGYYKAPELTAEAIDEDGWFHTGDIGILEDGKFLKITDRKKEMFKLSSGKYIAPQAIENRLKESTFIEQVMVIGENQKFASAIISPDFTYIHGWCSQNKIEYRDNYELIELPEITERFNKEVREVNKTLGEFEQIKRFRLVTEEWTPANGDLSPTLKLKRNYLMDKYKDIVNEIYFGGEKSANILTKIKTGIDGIFKNLPKF